MTSSLIGNPHSASSSSQATARRIDDVRFEALRLFKADPDHFDLIFVANATAGIKLIAECLREIAGGFWYGYHKDSHTSLIGVRETAQAGDHCFMSDNEVEGWLEGNDATINKRADNDVGLFAYPAQSNMNGRRLPLSWTGQLRSSTQGKNIYSLLDVAALVSTSSFDLSDWSAAPDFTVLSFYKMFGFPDLGALIVRKESASILHKRRYFGGGTVEMVVAGKENWHIRKNSSLHEKMEDGTLPIHSIIALEHAIKIHGQHFGTFEQIASHTSFLADHLYDRLTRLHHHNGVNVCDMYKDPTLSYGNARLQGPIIAFNVKDSQRQWISTTEFERLSNLRNIEIRSGGLCNPGGVASALELEPWEMRRNRSAGYRCGSENDVMGGKPTGVLRVSLGAMSTLQDVTTFCEFVEEFFIDKGNIAAGASGANTNSHGLYIEALTIYPIKSCAGWSIPYFVPWDVKDEGLLWDREWCLVHKGTGNALSQKSYPKMALLRPRLDFQKGLLCIRYHGSTAPTSPKEVSVPLSADPTVFDESTTTSSVSQICGDGVATQTYVSEHISNFFSEILGTQCTLARFPATTSGPSIRHVKPHLTTLNTLPRGHSSRVGPKSILLSNESPILAISRSSLNRLNEQIKITGGKAADASVFRANIIVAEKTSPGSEHPYMEDEWQSLQIGESVRFDVLGPCRRCQMITVDQHNGERNEEPFVTLAKTRRKEGKVFFGVHTALVKSTRAPTARISVGAEVVHCDTRRG